MQLLAHTGLNIRRIQRRIKLVKRPEPLDQILRRLFTDTGNTGDIVGAVAHERLDVDHLPWGNTILLPHTCDVISGRFGTPGSGRCKQYLHVIPHQLQAVTVARSDIAEIFRTNMGRERADDVIRFISLFGNDLISKRCQKLFEHGHLLGKLRRHPLARRFIAIVKPMAKGRALQIKRNRHRVGLYIFLKFQKNIHKAVDRVGVPPVFRGQQFDAVEGAIENAVSVEHKQLHGNHLCTQIACLYLIYHMYR